MCIYMKFQGFQGSPGILEGIAVDKRGQLYSPSKTSLLQVSVPQKTVYGHITLNMPDLISTPENYKKKDRLLQITQFFSLLVPLHGVDRGN